MHEQPLVSSRYVAAGCLFLIAAVVYYFFVWKTAAKRARDGVRLRSDFSPAFAAYVHNYYLFENLFACCFFAAWLNGITAPSLEAALAQVLTAVVFGLDQALFATKIWSRSPRLAFVLSGILLFLGFTAFIVISAFSPPLFATFSVAMVFLLVTVTVLTSEGWKSGVDRVWGMTYLAIYAALAAAAFGATVYGHLSPRFGGGASPKVQPVWAPELDESLKRLFSDAKDGIYLLASTEDSTVFELAQGSNVRKVVRVDRRFVTGIVFDAIPLSFAYGDAFDQLLRSARRVFQYDRESKVNSSAAQAVGPATSTSAK